METVCGNSRVEGTEDCDTDNLDGASCTSLGFDTGTLSCTGQCSFDTSGCSNISEDCDNGIIDEGETCDGTDFGSATCVSMGYEGGTLTCTACQIDPSSCDGYPCGNGIIDDGESCDGTNFGAVTCQSLGFVSGDLQCFSGCTAINTDLCIAPSDCGNGILNDGEECDGTEFGTATCSSLGWYAGGNLACDDQCRYVTDDCSGGYCGDGIIQPFSPAFEECDGTAGTPNCYDLGYWFSETTSCNSSCKADVSSCTEVLDVTGGYSHACALISTGQVFCWGNNSFGQLGNGLYSGSGNSPVEALIVLPAVKIRAYQNNTCAILSDGTVQCWGDQFSSTPYTVPGMTDAQDICVGTEHQCYTDSSGNMFCRGDNNDGQLGIGLLGGYLQDPNPVMDLTYVTDISCGSYHTCAISNGDVWCWGRGNDGQVGYGGTGDRGEPQNVLIAGESVSCGNRHTCAVNTPGDAYCWGDGTYRQVGYPLSGDRTSPFLMGNGFVSVSVRWNSSCGIRTDGNIWCWGGNDNGQLGNGTYNQNYQETAVSWTTTNITSMGGKGNFVCAVEDNRELRCWGQNGDGQLGLGTVNDSPVPVRVLSP